MAIRFLEWSTASDVIYSVLPYVRMTEAVACLSFSTIQLVLWIIPIRHEGRVVGSRTAVVYVRLALVQANPDSVSLVEARGLPIFLLLQNTECGSGLSSPRRTCGIAGDVAAN